MQSQDERDIAGLAAKRGREAMSLPEFVNEEITGRYEGEELERRRAARPPDEALRHLESKHDDLKRDVEKKHDHLTKEVGETRHDVKALSDKMGDVREEVAGAVGKLDGQAMVLTEVLSIVKKTAESKVEVDRAKELATIEVSREDALAKVKVNKETSLDTLDARKKRRTLLLKVVGLIASGGLVSEILHKLGVL
jgi:hypothetical protein